VLALGGLDLAAPGPAWWRRWRAISPAAVGHPSHGLSPCRPAADRPCRFGLLLAKALLAGIASGVVARLFAEANHGLGAFKRKLVQALWRPVIGGFW
jgi:H+/Cl- antiporter ClcA